MKLNSVKHTCGIADEKNEKIRYFLQNCLIIKLNLLQIESRLENPTKYHMLESQRKQVTLNFYQTQKLEIHLKNLLNHDDTLKTLAQVADLIMIL